ncbi:MAG: response regulator [Deltaproteobacteria bacterium]|nr:response regulator [Deltaproteobacteria bacterium]
MGNNEDVMKSIHEEQLDRVLMCLTIIGAFVLVASLSRALFMGWQNFHYIHIFTYITIIGIALFKKYLSHTIKSVLLAGIIFMLAILGLAKFGLIGYGSAMLLIFCIVATAFFGTWGGIIAVLLSAVSFAVIGASFTNGALTFGFDIQGYIRSPFTWILGTVSMVFLTGLIVIIISKINSQLIGLVRNLNKQNAELLTANRALNDALEEKRKLKIGLEQAQKMELVGIVAGGVVHDLNNVLAASINYPELLLMNTPEESPFREPLETIKKSGLKAAMIVEDLLTLSRRRVANKEVLDINSIVAECIAGPEVDRIRAFHPRAEIKVDYDDEALKINGFPVHFSKTLTNLISNGAEAMPHGGKIVIKTSRKIVTAHNRPDSKMAEGEYALLQVTDEGEGINEEEKEKIFEPFFTKKEMGRSGTGLGMTIVWNSVKDHDGYIFLDSVKGKGTTFNIYFPITHEPLPEKKTRPALPLKNGNGESILVVDDVKEQRDIAKKILTMLGYSVAVKSNGEEALDYIKKHPADLVLLDMIMQKGMDGLDTFIKIHEIKPKQKVIIISGYSETDRLKKALELGAGAYLKKPYLTETVAYAVREELDKKSDERIVYN